MASTHPLDFSQVSGVLDLSTSKESREPFCSSDHLPVHKFERDLDHDDDSTPLPSPTNSGSSRCTMGHGSKDYESSNCTCNSKNRSPSFYNADKDSSVSSNVESRRSSPNYASCYPGPEQLGPYIIQAAFRQQLVISEDQPAKLESDVTETGSDGSHNSFLIYPMVSSGRDGKVARPFKAYPKDPMSLAAGFSSVDALLDSQSAEKYSAFRTRMLQQIHAANGGQATITNPKMRRSLRCNGNSDTSCYTTEDGNTKGGDSYVERRKKNNAAAKKSRDRRRIKEDEIAIRASFLERENIELKFEVAALRKQLAAYGIPLTPM